MITVQSLGGASVACTIEKKNVVVFGDASAKRDADTLYLYDHPDDDPIKGTISWPGEYDVEGIMIRGIGHEEGKNISYVLEHNGVRLGFVFSPLHQWTDHNLELMGDVDVLFIPTDSPKILQKLVDEIDPRVLVPLDTGGAEKHAEAMKICGAVGKEAVKEYKIKGSLPTEGREVVVLEA